MANVKKWIGWFLLALPFVGIMAAPCIAAARDGQLMAVFIGLGVAIVMTGCIVLGLHLLEEDQ